MANFVSNDNATSLMNAINQKKDSKPSTITWAEWIALTDEQREGTHYIITNVPAKFSDKDAVFSIKDQTLTFTNKTATVTDSRITVDTYIFTFYHNQAVAQAAGIECSWTTGTVTFTVDENPSENIVVDILCILPALATPKEDITAEDVSYDNTQSGLEADNVQDAIDEVINSVEDGFKNIEIIIPPTITNYASYKNAGGNRGEDITKYWKDGSLADRIDGVNGFEPFEDLYLWDYIDLDSNITAPSSGGGSTTGTKRIHIGEFNGLNNYQLNKRTDNVNFFNHLRMVTGTHFGMSKMNDTNTTEGGYLGSKMHTDIIGDISTSGTLTKQLYDQLGSLLVPTTELLTNSINASGYNRFGANSGCSNNWTFADVYARLLSELESNGSIAWSSSGYDTGNAQHQLPAFKNDKAAAYPQGIYYWNKDIATSTDFCNSGGRYGYSSCDSASRVHYVRLLLTLGRKPS